MLTIFIASTGGAAGRSLAAWALAKKLKEKKLRVGFFKPYTLWPTNNILSKEEVIDPDLLLLKEVLHLPEPDNLLCPVQLTSEMLSQISKKEAEFLWEKIQQAFQEISRTKDVILAMGGKEIFWGEGISDFSDSILVKKFNAAVILLDHYQKDNLTMFSLLSLNSFLEGRVRTAILNHVPLEKIAHLKNKLIPFFQGKGIKSVVPIPEDSILAANSVEAINELIAGEIICGIEYKGNLIKDFTIGAKHLTGSISIFKQVYNRVILLRLPEKGAEQAAVGGIILTGGKKPGEIIMRVAQEASLPLILTRLDTFQTVERMEKIKPILSVKDSFKVHRFLELIAQESPQDEWLEALL
ncbi:MAG: DRTGG domain-containing protein [Thermodesulfobacteriota bacterium]